MYWIVFFTMKYQQLRSRTELKHHHASVLPATVLKNSSKKEGGIIMQVWAILKTVIETGTSFRSLGNMTRCFLASWVQVFSFCISIREDWAPSPESRFFSRLSLPCPWNSIFWPFSANYTIEILNFTRSNEFRLKFCCDDFFMQFFYVHI